MRELKPGVTHADVPKMKRPLVRWLNRTGHGTIARHINKRSRTYGPAAQRGVRMFQKAHGLTVDGIVGPRTWAKLRPASKPKRTRRDAMKSWMNWALHNEPSFHYRQSRPIPLAAMKRRQLPIYTDCSGSSTGAAYAAGFPDPNGRGYDGSGYTGTLRAHLPQIRLADAKVGDLIVYGGSTGSHVVIVYEPGPDPLCFSHGQESGPRLYRHSVQDAFHGGGFTVHDISGGR